MSEGGSRVFVGDGVNVWVGGPDVAVGEMSVELVVSAGEQATRDNKVNTAIENK